MIVDDPPHPAPRATAPFGGDRIDQRPPGATAAPIAAHVERLEQPRLATRQTVGQGVDHRHADQFAVDRRTDQIEMALAEQTLGPLAVGPRRLATANLLGVLGQQCGECGGFVEAQAYDFDIRHRSRSPREMMNEMLTGFAVQRKHTNRFDRPGSSIRRRSAAAQRPAGTPASALSISGDSTARTAPSDSGPMNLYEITPSARTT